MLKQTVVFLVFVGTVSPAVASLAPREVAIVAMAESADSRRVAEYYARARGVPSENILFLEGKPVRELPRTEWETRVRPAIRRWLREPGREETIRCFVTTWDVPLRVGRRNPKSAEVVERTEHLTQMREMAVGTLGELLVRAGGIGSDDEPPPPEWAPTIPREELTTAIESAFQDAQRRLATMSPQDPNRRQQTSLLEQTFHAAVGLNGLLQAVARGAQAGNVEGPAARRLDVLRGQLMGMSEGLHAVGRLPDNLARDRQLIGLVQKTGGLLGVVEWIDSEQELLRKNETAASFDSELSMVKSPDYVLFRWQPNLLHYRFDALPDAMRDVLMVARLEAPTLAITRRIIDDAIRIEQEGLQGKVYLDARGISYDPAKDQPGSYGQYDASLRDLAERLKRHTELEVVLDNKPALFQPGDCPDTAIYCGWYSLAKYVDAFEWNPGAVGYHIASAEATTLREPGARVWCSAMLEKGVAATLGPTFEPYLAAFPLPDDFFPLLMTGRYTLVETYFRTNPFNSWAMVLVGDPLYRPFAKNPPLSEDALPARMRGAETDPSPPAISELP